MEAVIGKIAGIQGVFYIRGLDGSLRKALENDKVYEGEVVIGDANNNPAENVTVSIADGSEIVVLGKEKQLFDSSLLNREFSNEDTVTNKDSIQALLEKNGDVDNIEDLETAAGEEEVVDSTDGVDSVFLDANGAITDINADLRDVAFAEETTESRDDNYLLNIDTNNTPIVTDVLATATETNSLERIYQGQLEATDLDTADTHIFQQTGTATVVTNGESMAVVTDLTVTVAANGSYTIDGNFDQLAEGETATVTFEYTATDDSGAQNAASEAKTVTLTVTGSNDQPIVSDVVVAATETNGLEIIYEGQLEATDLDTTDTHTFQQTGTATVMASNEVVQVTDFAVVVAADGSYTVNGNFDALADGETATVTFEYTATDNTGTVSSVSEPKTVILTVTGSNDQPVVSDVNVNSSIEHLYASGASLAQIETLAGTTISNSGSTPTNGSAIKFIIETGANETVSFNWDFFDAEEASSQSMINFNDFSFVVIDGVLMTLEDAVAQDVDGNTVLSHTFTTAGNHTITFGVMNSTDTAYSSALDVQHISGGVIVDIQTVGNVISAQNNIYETNGLETIYTGQLALTADLDTTDTHTFQVDANSITATLNGEEVTIPGLTVNITNADTGAYEVIGNFDQLAEGEMATVTFTYTATDDSAAPNSVSEPKTVTLMVTGTNDAPTFTEGNSTIGDDAGAVTEDTILSTNGTLSISDADAGESAFQPQTDAAAAYGTFSIAANGDWTYTLDNESSAVQALGDGDTLTDTINVLSADGTETSVTITINGTNDDAPIGITVTDTNGLAAGDVTVYENALSTGSDPLSIGETVTGTFVIEAGNGLQQITVEGTNISSAQLAASSTTNIIIPVTNGEMSIKGYNSTTGVVNYTYTLVSAAAHSVQGVDIASIDIDLTVTDVSNRESSATITVGIVDDVVTLNNPMDAMLSSTQNTVLTGDLNLVIGADKSGASIILSGGTEYITGTTIINGNSVVQDLTLDGAKLKYVANVDGSLSAVTDEGVIAYTVTTDIDAGTYQVTMLQTLDNAISGVEVVTGLSGGNSSIFTLQGTSFDIVATGTEDGATSTVNTSANTIGVGAGQNIASNEKLNISFTDHNTGSATTMTSISLTATFLKEGETLTWSANDGAYSGEVYGNSSGQVSFVIDLSNVPDGIDSLEFSALYTACKDGTPDVEEYKLAIDSVQGQTSIYPLATNIDVKALDGDGDSMDESLSFTFVGDSTFTFTSNTVIEGGDGYDILLVESSVDFSLVTSDVKNIEEIHLGDGAQDVTLTLSDVLSITDVDNDLYITGDGDLGDSVSLDTVDGWSKSETQSQVGFNEYSSTEDPTVKLQIQDDIEVKLS